MKKPTSEIPHKTNPGLLTPEEAASRLRVSRSQVYALHGCGRLRGYRLTTKDQECLRFSEEQIREFLDQCERGGFDRQG